MISPPKESKPNMRHRVINILLIRQRHFLKQQTTDQFKNHTHTHIYMCIIYVFISVWLDLKKVEGENKARHRICYDTIYIN